MRYRQYQVRLVPATVGSMATTDGRSTRWDEHRTQRRTELVDATIRAVRAHGPAVGMDEIAAMAGTSKTVVYRHFTDRAGLYAAVAERVESLITRDVRGAVDGDPAVAGAVAGAHGADGRRVIGAAIDAYLRLVERDPELYRFVVAAPLLERSEDSAEAGGVPTHLAREIGDLVATALRAGGLPVAAAPVWGTAVVGMVRAAADDWLRPDGATHGRSRESLCEDLTTLAWSGLGAAWPMPSPTEPTPTKECR